MEKTNPKQNIVERPPIVVVMGHIDHGKSTLLDYIRKSNIVDTEAGGITQNISAYEVVHKDESGKEKKITFLDTPGHEAFSRMRERGADIADIAILVVSAEDGVKTQTIEAWKTIVESKILSIVAINKIDKPGANIEKTKMELAENEIYLENYGGKIPYAEISAKTGAGVDNLLSLILLLSEMENFTGDTDLPASGQVLEANLDPRRGIEASLVIKNGTIKRGMAVAVLDAICPVKIMENFLGKTIDETTFSSPIRLVGFSKMPKVGAEFKSFKNKRDAEEYIKNRKEDPVHEKISNSTGENKKIIPIVVKADVSGTLEAIEKEVSKINCGPDATVSKNTEFRIIGKGVGTISESDIKSVASSEDALVIGFNVKADRSAVDLAEKRGIEIAYFNIIYKMTEWLSEEMEKRRLKIETSETVGKAKILKAFSHTKERQILGGKVLEGQIALGSAVKILRREFEIGAGKIVNLEKNKTKTSAIEEGSEFGMMIESKTEIVPGDVIESFTITKK
jgi:translation initiation factor IF-2